MAATGIAARVVSAPCIDLFLEQGRRYRDEILPPGVPCIGVEAALRYGWDALIGSDGEFVGMTGFGASAPAGQLYELFGITTDAIVDKARKRLSR